MVRPKKHVTASQKNGATSAKKKTFKRVAVLADDADDDPWKAQVATVVYRAKPKKGYFWQDEINSDRYFVQETERDKRRRGNPPPRDKTSAKRADEERAEKWRAAEKQAVKMIKKNTSAHRFRTSDDLSRGVSCLLAEPPRRTIIIWSNGE